MTASRRSEWTYGTRSPLNIKWFTDHAETISRHAATYGVDK